MAPHRGRRGMKSEGSRVALVKVGFLKHPKVMTSSQFLEISDSLIVGLERLGGEEGSSIPCEALDVSRKRLLDHLLASSFEHLLRNRCRLLRKKYMWSRSGIILGLLRVSNLSRFSATINRPYTARRNSCRRAVTDKEVIIPSRHAWRYMPRRGVTSNFLKFL